jgi:YidC/Oxa1 family membrane protein insertase
MDRNSLVRMAVIGLLVVLFMKFGMPLISGKGKTPQPIPVDNFAYGPDFIPDAIDAAKGGTVNAPVEGELCSIVGDRYRAELSTRGAAVKHFYITDAQYADAASGFDVSTTPDHEKLRSLRTWFRGDGASDQVEFDRFNWQLSAHDAASCTFSYSDNGVELTKVVRASGRAFEVAVETTVKNRSDVAKKHRFGIGLYAYRANKEVKGKLGRVSPFMTQVTCAGTDEVVRKGADDFKEGWFTKPGIDRYGAVSNYYFGQAIVPAAGDKPECNLLVDHLTEVWSKSGIEADADEAGASYQMRLQYPAKELGPGASATYTQSAFFGPKERNVLASAAGGTAKLSDMIDLGFFSPVAKVLVSVLLFFHDKVTHNWGLAIIMMTVCVKLLLFPASLKGIKNTVAMRKAKPEVDALNLQFKDDPQAKNLAVMELYRKRGVNPMDQIAGCLPQLVTMPVWWAMYTTLQTAVEMYHSKFLWFSDLSSADKYYILPLVLGGLGLLQARIMPQQAGADPMQQKMMQYMMPVIFTVMMLFLPAALGVYMTTNSIFGILQQLAVERYTKSAAASANAGEIRVSEVQEASASSGKPALKKGKADV